MCLSKKKLHTKIIFRIKILKNFCNYILLFFKKKINRYKLFSYPFFTIYLFFFFLIIFLRFSMCGFLLLLLPFYGTFIEIKSRFTKTKLLMIFELIFFLFKKSFLKLEILYRECFSPFYHDFCVFCT